MVKENQSVSWLIQFHQEHAVVQYVGLTLTVTLNLILTLTPTLTLVTLTLTLVPHPILPQVLLHAWKIAITMKRVWLIACRHCSHNT